MNKHFTYKSLVDLRREAERMHLDISFEENLDHVWRSVPVGRKILGNSIGIHPMEGCDGTHDGKPDELTYRRWKRFGESGAKLLWGEATAVTSEGRANARQLQLSEANLKSFEQLVSATRLAHRERFGSDDNFLIGLQLTHSGRFSYRKPIIAHHNPVIDARTFLDKEKKILLPSYYPVISDDELARLEDAYVLAAGYAARVGFDFVDIKQCHTYLLNELLSARSREGKYGGSFKNRTRFIRNVLRKIRDTLGDSMILASRINAFDGIPFQKNADGIGAPSDVALPYTAGFGVDANNPLLEDLLEPLRLVAVLVADGVKLLNVSLGSPYFNPHIGRPFERPSEGSYASPEHPLIGVDRHFRITETIQRTFPDIAVVGTGYSWLQQYFIYAAESNLRKKRVSIVALGRGAIAYPDFVADLLADGKLKSTKVCITASFCTDMMRAKDIFAEQLPAGCVPRDKLYADLYKKNMKDIDQ